MRDDVVHVVRVQVEVADRDLSLGEVAAVEVLDALTGELCDERSDELV